MADQKVLNIEGTGNIPFVYSEEPGLPSWAAVFPSNWCESISEKLYDFAKNNFLVIVNSDLSDKKDFTFGISKKTFENLSFDDDLGVFRKFLLALHDTTCNASKKVFVQIYVSFFCDSNDNFIHAIVDNNNIIIGALSNKPVSNNNLLM